MFGLTTNLRAAENDLFHRLSHQWIWILFFFGYDVVRKPAVSCLFPCLFRYLMISQISPLKAFKRLILPGRFPVLGLLQPFPFWNHWIFREIGSGRMLIHLRPTMVPVSTSQMVPWYIGKGHRPATGLATEIEFYRSMFVST